VQRDYYKFIDRANEEFAERLGKPVLMIPFGDIVCELDKRLKAGKIPGLPELYQRFADKALLQIATLEKGCHRTFNDGTPETVLGLKTLVVEHTDADRANSRRSLTPTAVWPIRSARRFVQPTRVESDRAKLLYGDLHALTSVYTWAT
jgi:hypothetical protein